MTQEQKEWIDRQGHLGHLGLLRRWRFGEVGDPIFREGEAGEYYARAMREKRALTPDRGVRDSKQLGWDPQETSPR